MTNKIEYNRISVIHRLKIPPNSTNPHSTDDTVQGVQVLVS